MLATIRWEDIPPGHQGALIVAVVFVVFAAAVVVFLARVAVRSLIDRWRWRRLGP